MDSLTKKKVLLVGIGMLVLLSFLVCSHSVPMSHDGGQHSISDCSFIATGIPTISKTVLGIAGLLLLLGLGFVSNLFGQDKIFKIDRSILGNLSPPPLTYPPGNSLLEAFRKGIIHTQLYSFVVV